MSGTYALIAFFAALLIYGIWETYKQVSTGVATSHLTGRGPFRSYNKINNPEEYWHFIAINCIACVVVIIILGALLRAVV
jgi:TRAP-type C4-dicarboxylate transport system permease small subunit